MNRLLKFSAYVVFCYVACSPLGRGALAAAGKIQFAIGDAKVLDGRQQPRPAKKGEAVDQGETILTGVNGSVQVTLADGGLIAVRPNTQLRIDAYAYSGKADDKNNKSVFSLAKGTFRSITGAIGKQNPDAYRVETPGATMGIRGTDHEPAVVLPLLPGQVPLTPLQAARPGTYDFVNSGQTFIQTPNGLVVLNPNQVGFAPVGGGVPLVLPNVPGFYGNTPKPGPANGPGGVPGSGNKPPPNPPPGSQPPPPPLNLQNPIGPGLPGSLPPPPPPPPPISPTSSTTSTTTTSTTTTTTTTTTSTTTATTGTPAPLGSGLVGAFVDSPTSATAGAAGGPGSVYVTQPSPTQEILIGSQNEVFHIFDGTTVACQVTPCSFEFFSGTGALTDQGSFTFSDGGRVDWGRWTAGYTVYDNGVQVTPIGDFHYVFSKDITDPTLVTMPGALTGGLYGYVGGTSPTNQSGVAGSIIPTATSLNVDFVNQVVTLNVGTSISGVTLTGSATGTIPAFISPSAGIFSTNGNFVRANGFFIGPTAAGAVSSFEIQDATGSGNSAIGTAVFKR